MSSRHVIVVGGGVIGAACAYYLNRADWQVTVLDRAGFGSGCSHGNCGYISPSHVLPQAVPGAIRAGLTALLQPNGPLSIKPRLDPTLWSWLLGFARRCNERDMLEAARAIQALLNSSRALYPEIIQHEKMECEWETKGLLFVYATPRGMDHHAHLDKILSESFSLPAQRLDRDSLLAQEPTLKPTVAGAWFYEGDAHLRPDRLMAEWRRVLSGAGVTLRENCETQAFVKERGRVVAVATPQGQLRADAFVIATGALTPLLSKELGCRIPIQPGKGYSITMPRPTRCPNRPMLFEEHRVAITPMQSGYRIGSTMEFAGYDTTLNRKRLELLKEGARHYLHEPICEPVLEEWFGWRPMTYDGKPIIDRSPTLENVVIAAGHNMLGLSMAPATGKLVAEMLDGAPHLDPTPYSLKRF